MSRKQKKSQKIIKNKPSEQSLEAYQKWLTKKLEQEKDEQIKQMHRREEEIKRKKRELEERRQEAETRFKEWCEKKKNQYRSKSNKLKNDNSELKIYQSKSETNSQSNFDAWLLKKIRKQKGRLMYLYCITHSSKNFSFKEAQLNKLKEMKSKLIHEMNRKHGSEEAYAKWLYTKR